METKTMYMNRSPFAVVMIAAISIPFALSACSSTEKQPHSDREPSSANTSARMKDLLRAKPLERSARPGRLALPAPKTQPATVSKFFENYGVIPAKGFPEFVAEQTKVLDPAIVTIVRDHTGVTEFRGPD